MFGFGKKKKEDEEEAPVEGEEEGEEEGDEGEEEKEAAPAAPAAAGGGAEVAKLAVQIEKINASLQAGTEVRKTTSERFTRITEQIGEVRQMILDRDKSIQNVELKAVKAHDLVATVQPEKMMTSIQKGEAKIEALKANLEGNESIMSRIMDELKDIKRKVEFFRGVEEVVKMSEETKKDLIETKKVQSKIALDTDKVETIYAEMRKKFQSVEVVDSSIQEVKTSTEQSAQDVQFLKDKVTDLASKEDLEKLVTKVQRYIDALKELEKKSSMTKDIDRLKEILDELK